MQFAPHVKFETIACEADIDKLSVLVGKKIIGVDSEWRPQVNQFQAESGPAILQLASHDETFIIDLLSLASAEKLDKQLIEIFTHPDTLLVGFGFDSDIFMFRKFLPNLEFTANIPRLLEVQEFFMAVAKVLKWNSGNSLANVCKQVLGKQLCKSEQMSNWERRPLRKSQEHYALMDSWIMISLYERLLEVVSEKGLKLDMLKYTKRIKKPLPKKEEAKEDVA